jgi:hypothetical protein
LVQFNCPQLDIRFAGHSFDMAGPVVAQVPREEFAKVKHVYVYRRLLTVSEQRSLFHDPADPPENGLIASSDSVRSVPVFYPFVPMRELLVNDSYAQRLVEIYASLPDDLVLSLLARVIERSFDKFLPQQMASIVLLR